MRLTFSTSVCAGFLCMTLLPSRAWSQYLACIGNIDMIGNNLATYLWLTVTVTTKRSHYNMLYKGSKWQKIWRCAKLNGNQCMHYWGISSLSVWWAEDLNLTGRGRWASAHAPTFDDPINFWGSTNLFHNKWWWEYCGLAEQYEKVWANLGNLAQNLVWPLNCLVL